MKWKSSLTKGHPQEGLNSIPTQNQKQPDSHTFDFSSKTTKTSPEEPMKLKANLVEKEGEKLGGVYGLPKHLRKF